jgi:hypothetical protein
MDTANVQQFSLNLKMNSFYSYNEKVQQKTDENTKLDAKTLQMTYVMEFQLEISVKSQNNVKEQADVFTLADIGYTGKPIGDLTQDEAKELVSEDGFFGIEQTSQRIADFVINGAGDDPELLKAGLEGIMRGFKEAEEMWGDKLPQISYDTIKRADELIKEHMQELGIPVLDMSV